MTTYQTIRLEAKEQEVFFQIKITCDTGTFNYAKWMTPAEAQEYIIDTTTFDSIITNNYLHKAVDEYNNTPPADLWHFENEKIQIVFTLEEQMQFILANPDFLQKVIQAELPTASQYKNAYIYANFILDTDMVKLRDEQYTIQINCAVGFHLVLNEGVWIAVKD